MKRGIRFLVAIPVHNEERLCPRVIDRTLRFARHILIVNDGSTDRTLNVLSGYSHVDLVNHPKNLGYGQALITAFNYAIRHRYDYLLTMDCDEQHEPEAIPLFAAEMPDYDIVSGSRYLYDWPDDDPAPPERLRVNRTITRLVNRLTGYRLTDTFCGQKAYAVPALKRLRITETGYAMPLQVWMQAAALGLTVKEIPVRRIYKDYSRRFGGGLDDAAARMAHYLEVIARARVEAEALAAERRAAPRAGRRRPSTSAGRR